MGADPSRLMVQAGCILEGLPIPPRHTHLQLIVVKHALILGQINLQKHLII